MSGGAIENKKAQIVILMALFTSIILGVSQDIFTLSGNAPINSKLQHPPPRAYPGHLTVHRARGGGNLNVALEGWGI